MWNPEGRASVKPRSAAGKEPTFQAAEQPLLTMKSCCLERRPLAGPSQHCACMASWYQTLQCNCHIMSCGCCWPGCGLPAACANPKGPLAACLALCPAGPASAARGLLLCCGSCTLRGCCALPGWQQADQWEVSSLWQQEAGVVRWCGTQYVTINLFVSGGSAGPLALHSMLVCT
jgi:hypothetical protein